MHGPLNVKQRPVNIINNTPPHLSCRFTARTMWTFCHCPYQVQRNVLYDPCRCSSPQSTTFRTFWLDKAKRVCKGTITGVMKCRRTNAKHKQRSNP